MGAVKITAGVMKNLCFGLTGSVLVEMKQEVLDRNKLPRAFHTT
jgi:hypothetical protein